MSEEKKKQELPFEASAYLQRLIGRELITNEELAIIELVKNAHDAAAHHVTITIRTQSEREPGEITIRDDGTGMNLNALKRIFLFAGYSERPEQVATAARVPTGEKGIGRFAADKLGHELSVTTQNAEAKRALRMTINWDRFGSRKKRFNQITAPYTYLTGRAPELLGSAGTILRITRLRTVWDRAKIIALRESLAGLLDPFNPPADFEIDLQVPGSIKLTGPITSPPLASGDIELSFEVFKSGKVRRSLLAPLLEIDQEPQETPTVADTKPITGLTGRITYFLTNPKKSETRGLPPGVRLYRDGFRVEPFGRTSDWLGVAERKAKRAGHAHVVPSHLFGFISISRKQHPELIHTTSREALITGEAVQQMVTFLREQLAFLEDNIRTKVTEPRWKESKTRKAAELERTRFHSLSILSLGLAHELRQPLQAIRTEADNIRERLLQLHINDVDIRDAQESIDSNVERIDRNIQAIAAISSGSVEKIEAIDLAKLIRDQCDLLRPRCSQAGITLEVGIPTQQEGNVNAMTFTSLIVNLVQNAVEALETQNGDKPKRIKVTLTKIDDKHVLEVLDNGPGIDGEIRPKVFRRFASKKTGGWGVGLYHCSLLVKSHGGLIDFTSSPGLGTNFRAELPDV